VATIERTLTGEGIEVLRVPLTGKTAEEQTWNGFLLGHWAGLALARERKVDPTHTPLIAHLKKEVSR
jgi:hypothetical protein